ncbi:MAG: recombinase family protein [Desulfobulbaceae bacterium]|nr:recombinase family protein [Desulfobulbaceae bacterium]
MSNSPKALIYNRVSTKEQADKGYSLEGQEKDCRKFALDNGYEVDKVFTERGESAKTQDRTQLQKMIRYSVENKKKLSAIIIWKYDRLTRNLADQMELVKNFSSLGIRVLSATENNEDTSVGKLMRNIIGSFSQYENDIKSERAKNGMKEALEQGRWVWAPPLGYKQRRDDKNKPILVPSEDAPIIVEAFEMIATGLYKQTDVVKVLRKKGFKNINANRLNCLLRNHLFAGMIKHPWLPQVIDAIHQPLIEKYLFYKVQAILDGKRPQVTPKSRNNPAFPLRRFICCPYCGAVLTAGHSSGRRKDKTYPYYHCWTRGCSFNIKKGELEGKFYEYLKSFQPTDEALKLFEATVIDVYKTLQAEQIKTYASLEKQLSGLYEERKSIEKLVVKGTFSEETYKRRSAELENEITVKQLELNEAKIDINDIEACLNYCKYFLTHLADLWLSADLDSKQRLQALIFPQKVTYNENGTLGTTATASIFRQLQGQMSRESNLVAPTGFEPVFAG